MQIKTTRKLKIHWMQWQIICKKLYSNLQPFVQETKIVSLNQQDTGNREDLSIDPVHA